MNSRRYWFFLGLIASSLLLLFLSLPAQAEDTKLDINAGRNRLYNNYASIKKNIFQKYDALNPDGTVNKNAAGYGSAVSEIEPYHKEMMDQARELGVQRERINEKIYSEAGAEKPSTSGTDAQSQKGREGEVLATPRVLPPPQKTTKR